jgi:hypothetical protein
MKEKWRSGVGEKRGIKMANSKWVRDNRKLKGEALRTYLEEYAKKHFLGKGVRDVRIKMCVAYIYNLCNGL